MVILFNILVVALVALIAYWWANQGFLSALLHFICVVAAGAIAFALWEPLTVGLLLRGGWFDDYAWGTSLLGVFLVSLFLLRLAFDKLVPDNANLPTWANYAFGTLFGAGAGVLTVGICLIGIGFMQSSVEIMGFRGAARDSSSAGQPSKLDSLYPPLHTWTTEFYGFVGDGALAPTFSRASLRRSYPDLDQVAFSLFRDTFLAGQGKTTLPPDSVRVNSVVHTAAGTGRVRSAFGVLVSFDRPSFDRGERLVLSASQVRLIGRDAQGNPVAVHPSNWSQMVDGATMGDFAFDDVSAYATSVAGANDTRIFFVFPAGDFGGTMPEYLQVRGVRYRLPPIKANAPMTEFVAARTEVAGKRVELAFDPNAPFADGDEVRVDSSINPLTLSINQISGFEIVDNLLASGTGEFPRDAGNLTGSRALRIRGLVEPTGTKVVKVKVSRKQDNPIDIWNDRSDFRTRAGSGAMPMLVASDGRVFPAYGFFWLRSGKAQIKLDPSRGIRSLNELPQLSSAGNDDLWLLFQVTEGARLVNFMLGQPGRDGKPEGVVVANLDLTVSGPAARSGQRGQLSAE